MKHTGYSVAIRTLGLNPEVLRQVLEAVYRQTVAPDAVRVYIAKGYKIPDFRVGGEEYVATEKGMMRQRALPYAEVDSPYILFLDDDVILADDCAATLLDAITEGYQCVAPDVFANQDMSAAAKVYAAVSNLTFPHHDRRYAFKVRSTGSFSYLAHPEPRLYLSQSASGPCSMWEKQAFIDTEVQQELWLETLGFPYCEDQITFYKLHVRGGRLGIHYGARVTNANAQTSSSHYHRDPQMLYKRARAQYMVWHRSVLGSRTTLWGKAKAITAFTLKSLWLIPVHIATAIRYGAIKAPYLLIKGTWHGIRLTHSPQYQSLPPYKI